MLAEADLVHRGRVVHDCLGTLCCLGEAFQPWLLEKAKQCFACWHALSMNQPHHPACCALPCLPV
jgi:hypothetical protein